MMEPPASLMLIQNAEVFAPDPLGKKDVLITADRIGWIDDAIQPPTTIPTEVIDARGKILVPGFIDGHVHILGGGGEGSYKTRTPEIMLSGITMGGVTTVVGCLGTDGVTRTMTNLIAKARGLEEEGVSCYILTGSYQIPVRTLTGSILDDLILIDKVIGVGEVALSDHRSSQPTIDEVAKIAAAARVGGMLSGKAGIVNIHMGEGERKFQSLDEIVRTTEIPITQFVPTHVARNAELLKAGIAWAKQGGLIDFTTSLTRTFPDQGELGCDAILKQVLDAGVPVEQVTFTSDGQGSLPVFDAAGAFIGLGVGEVASLFQAVRNAVQKQDISLQTALKVITSNPARNMKLTQKGSISVGQDADLVLLDADLHVDTVMARGQVMVREKEVIVLGMFETGSNSTG